MPTLDIGELVNIQPQLPGYELAGAEPSIGHLIYLYYVKYFPHDQAIDLSVQYTKQLCKQWNEATQ